VHDSVEGLEPSCNEDPSSFQAMAGAVWLRRTLRIERISCFGAKVAHLLDRMVDGIYHLPESALQRAEWHNDHHVEISWYRGISTYDSDELTRMVLLCHELSIRGTVKPSNPRYLRLGFSRRIRNGGLCDGHPTIQRVLMGFNSRWSETRRA